MSLLTLNQIVNMSHVATSARLTAPLPLVNQIIYLDSGSSNGVRPDGNQVLTQIEKLKVSLDTNSLHVQSVKVDNVPNGRILAHIAALTKARPDQNVLILEDNFKLLMSRDELVSCLEEVKTHFEDRWHVVVLSNPTLSLCDKVETQVIPAKNKLHNLAHVAGSAKLVMLNERKPCTGYLVNANYVSTLVHVWMEAALMSPVPLETKEETSRSKDVWVGLTRLKNSRVGRKTWHVEEVRIRVNVTPNSKTINVNDFLRSLYLESYHGHRLRVAVCGSNLTKKRHRRAYSMNSFSGVRYFETLDAGAKWLGNHYIDKDLQVWVTTHYLQN